MSKRSLAFVILGTCVVVGCGDDHEVGPASEVERSAALELIDQTRTLRTIGH